MRRCRVLLGGCQGVCGGSVGETGEWWRLQGTVKTHSRLVVVDTGEEEGWGRVIGDTNAFIGALLREFKKGKEKGRAGVRVVACAGGRKTEGGGGGGYDVMVFPDQVRYPGVDVPQVKGLVQAITSDSRGTGIKGNGLLKEDLILPQVFVCCHSSRDARCGVHGHRLYQHLINGDAEKGGREGEGGTDPATKSRDLAELREAGYEIRKISHIGGHKYAGNVLVFPQNRWYGGVTVDNLPEVVRDMLLCREEREKAPRSKHYRGCTGEENNAVIAEARHVHPETEKGGEEGNHGIRDDGTKSFEFAVAGERGMTYSLQGNANETVLECAKRSGLDKTEDLSQLLPAVCDSSAACGTCRIRITSTRTTGDDGFFTGLQPQDETELDALDSYCSRLPQPEEGAVYRLSCCMRAADIPGDARVEPWVNPKAWTAASRRGVEGSILRREGSGEIKEKL
eukprot:Nk52_evm1s2235 gene=Nk52_evmTU1s2235